MEELGVEENDDPDEFEMGNLDAIIGSNICGINLGSSSAKELIKTYNEVLKKCEGSPIISIRADIFWSACYTSRRIKGQKTGHHKNIDWLEWRVIVAIYSLKPNSYGFNVAGWESIRNRSCGCHNKQMFTEQHDVFPKHLEPLKRRKTENIIKKLERNNFFLRHRIGVGSRGGNTAYSIRIRKREELAVACFEWRRYNKQKVSENRERDLNLCKMLYADGAISLSPDQSIIFQQFGPIAVQPEVQAQVQHNKKVCSKKDRDEEIPKNNDPADVGGWDRTRDVALESVLDQIQIFS
jgi:hypothetical protein